MSYIVCIHIEDSSMSEIRLGQRFLKILFIFCLLGLAVQAVHAGETQDFFIGGQSVNLQKNIADSLHSFQYNDASGDWYADNYGQHLSIRTTDAGGILISSANGSFGMQLRFAGRDITTQSATRGVAKAEGRLFKIIRKGYTEWYLNDDGGIEQGITIQSSPEGTGNLHASFDLSGNLTPYLSGETLVLSDRLGPVLRYTDLKAWDSTGRELNSTMALTGNQLLWEVDDASAIYPVRIDPVFTESKILSASDKSDNDQFGFSVSISENTVIVGTPYAGSGGTQRGQAYIFSRNEGGPDAWGQVNIITAPDKADNDWFGMSVSAWYDTVIVGAPYAASGGTKRGQAYVFSKDQGGPDAWGLVKILTASDKTDKADFGTSVSISADTVVVAANFADAGCTHNGQAYIFSRDQGGMNNWGEVKILSDSDGYECGQFGRSVSVSDNTAVVGADLSEKVYVFSRNQGGADNWGKVKILSASDGGHNDWFGTSVSVTGATLLVGAPYAASGGTQRGQVYVFSRDRGGVNNWGEWKILSAPDKADNNNFGCSVSARGGTGGNAIIGAYQASSTGRHLDGKAYVYSWDYINKNWDDIQVISSSGKSNYNNFGYSVSIWGDTAVIGAPGSASGGMYRGQAYIFAVVHEQIPVLSVTSISPATASNSGTIRNVQVTGTGFISGATLKMVPTWAGENIPAINVTVLSPTTLAGDFNLTNKSQGSYIVSVSNPDGTSATLPNGFTITGEVPPPPTPLSVTGISPSTKTNEQSISATVTGTGFKTGAVVKLTLAGQPDIVASGVTLTGNTTITCTFDLTGKATGTWDLAVTNPVDGTTSVRSTAFTITSPHVTETSNGIIIVSSTPPDALVYLDGVWKGTGSVTLQDVSPGYHSVRVTKTMYNDYGTDVRVVAGSPSYVIAVLIPAPGPLTSGTIIASSNPAGANVYLDGMDKGSSPATITNVSSGPHTVSFTKTGYTAASRSITMNAGQTMQITVDLTKTGENWGDWMNTTTMIIIGIIVFILIIIGVLLRKKKNRWDTN